MAKIIEFIGRPGAGKSTTATELFSALKRLNYKVEFVPEYVKELTYSKDFTKLNDQLLVTATQNHREVVLLNSDIDYIITDTSLLLGNIYSPSKLIETCIDECRAGRDYTTVLLTNVNGDYQSYGRIQSKDEALSIADQVQQMLDDSGAKYIVHDKSTRIDVLVNKIINGD